MMLDAQPSGGGPRASVAYAAAFIAAAAGVGVRLLLDPLFADRFPFLVSFVMVLLVARYCGWGPALLTLAGGAMAVAWFVAEPRFSIRIDLLEHRVGLVLFVLVGSIAVALFNAVEKARKSAEADRFRLCREIAARQSAEEELAGRQELLQTTFDCLSDAVVTTDADGIVASLNPVACQLTGWLADEARGRPLTEIFPIVGEQDRKPCECPVARALQGGTVVCLVNRTVLSDRRGRQHSIEGSAAPIRSAAGKVLGCVLVFRDVTERKRSAEALFASEERLRAFMDNNPAMAWLKDEAGRYVLASASFVAPFGRTQQETIGRTDQELFSPRIAEEYRRNDLEVLAAGRPIEFTELTEEPDGEHSHLAVKFPVRDAQGRQYVGGVAIDITRQKAAEARARAETRRVQLVADAVPALIAYIDADCCYRLCNRSYETWFGHPRNELYGRHMRDVLGEAAWCTLRPHVEAALRGEFVAYEAEVPYRHAGTRWISATYTPDVAQDGAVRGFVAHVIDVSRRRLTEEALRDSDARFRRAADGAQALVYEVDLPADDGRDHVAHTYGIEHIIGPEPLPEPLTTRWWHRRIHPEDLARHLEDVRRATDDPRRSSYRTLYRVLHCDGSWRHVDDAGQIIRDADGRARRLAGTILDVTERTQAQAALLESERQLRDADRRKDEFLATLAHELRNPLAPIRAALELLQSDSDQRALQHARSTMERQVAQMVRLIDDLLDVSRITRNRLELRREHVELAAVVQQAVDACRPLCEQAGHQLHVTLAEQPIVVDADPVRLAQVFGNLLTNACKYTPRAGQIWLTVQSQADSAVVTVRDSGVGIPSEMLPRVFDLFTQVDRSLARSAGGLGIGLSLVRRLVEMHGGTVEAHSEGPGRGAEFCVRLPVEHVDEAQRASPPAPHVSPIRARRILIVDDNQDAARTLAMLLKAAGHETHMAHDGVAALEAAATLCPDLILLDIGLPRLNGYDVCRAVRAEAWGAGVDIVALTGWGQDSDRRQSAAAGFDAHLVKPVDFATLNKLFAELSECRAPRPQPVDSTLAGDELARSFVSGNV